MIIIDSGRRTMKKTAMALSLVIFLSSCGSITFITNFLKERLSVQDVVNWKVDMDNSENPAYTSRMEKRLKSKRIRIEKIKIKDIIDSKTVVSTNVDYKFCIVVSVPTNKGDIDCYVYAGTGDIFPVEDLKTISILKKGVTIVNIEGDFSKFFTLLDETYTKIEIVNANIDIVKN